MEVAGDLLEGEEEVGPLPDLAHDVLGIELLALVPIKAAKERLNRLQRERVQVPCHHLGGDRYTAAPFADQHPAVRPEHEHLAPFAASLPVAASGRLR